MCLQAVLSGNLQFQRETAVGPYASTSASTMCNDATTIGPRSGHTPTNRLPMGQTCEPTLAAKTWCIDRKFVTGEAGE